MSTSTPLGVTAPTGRRRACGYRIAGGIYAETKVTGIFFRSPTGSAESFNQCVFDPPIPVDLGRLGLRELGVKLVERKTPEGDSVWHVLDVVGATYYPYPADFIAEAKRFGVSRRISREIDFGKLSEQSRLILIHQKAWIENSGEYFAARASGEWDCPKGLANHLNPAAPPAMCSGLWYEDLGDCREGDRRCTRKVATVQYAGKARPEGVTPVYRHAMFASFPISNIAVIKDADGGTHETALERASRASLPVSVEEA